MKNKLKNTGVLWLLAVSLIVLASSFVSRSDMPQNEKIVRDYYKSYEKKDWNMLRSILADNFTFTSPNDDHISLQSYKVRCWPNSANTTRFDIVKLVMDGNEAYVTYNGWTNNGKLFRNTEYFKLKDGKILVNECFFGRGVSFPNNKEKK